jgi:hypothetical protein
MTATGRNVTEEMLTYFKALFQHFPVRGKGSSLRMNCLRVETGTRDIPNTKQAFRPLIWLLNVNVESKDLQLYSVSLILWRIDTK